MQREISNRVFLELLEKQPYNIPVQSVIYSALEYYFNLKKNDRTFGAIISCYIKDRIREEAIEENDIDGYVFDYEIAKKILIYELEEQAHEERVEDVFFWALKAFGKSVSTCENKIARQIVDLVEFEERKLMN